jgi:hypothetical protein
MGWHLVVKTIIYKTATLSLQVACLSTFKKGRISPPKNSRDDPLTTLKLLLVILRSESRSPDILMP